MKTWQVAAAIAVGVVVGVFEPRRFDSVLAPATLYVFLPPLLFEAAWNLSYRAIVRQWRAIATLAGPGVVITALLIAGALLAVRVDLGSALLMGAILSATDPIAVIAIFRSFKVPKTLETIVLCESLFNDAVAVALYRGVLAAILIGAVSLQAASIVALQTVFGAVAGIALGAVLAFAVARALSKVARVEPQIVATLLCVYGVYFAGEYFHLSGIFATIAFGIALRYFERRWITLTIAEGVDHFWNLAAWVANAFVFFLLGAALHGHLGRDLVFVAACLVAIAVSRFAVAQLLSPAGYPAAWLNVIRVAGVRGALSVALALAVPAAIAYRQAMVDASFVVALTTIIAGSVSASRVMRTVQLRPASS